MAQDQRKRMQTRAKKAARTAAKAAKRKKTANLLVPDFANRFGVSRTSIRKAPLYRVLVSRSICSDGIGDVLVSRKLDDGSIVMGLILLDTYCLGVKNAFLRIVSQWDLDDVIQKLDTTQTLEEVGPAYACKLVEDAVAYARTLGFEPHPDFKDAVLVLEGIDPTACDTVFTFGKDGKPLYVNGPNHSMQQSNRIIAHLTALLGKDGFHYLIGSEIPEDFTEV